MSQSVLLVLQNFNWKLWYKSGGCISLTNPDKDWLVSVEGGLYIYLNCILEITHQFDVFN